MRLRNKMLSNVERCLKMLKDLDFLACVDGWFGADVQLVHVTGFGKRTDELSMVVLGEWNRVGYFLDLCDGVRAHCTLFFHRRFILGLRIPATFADPRLPRRDCDLCQVTSTRVRWRAADS